MNLKTGDFLLFEYHPKPFFLATIDSAIRCFSHSKYSHAGFVIVDPPWAPKGTYVWDSSYHFHPDPQDNKIKFGIALVKINDYINLNGKEFIYKRSPADPNIYKLFNKKFLQTIHDKVYGKHYDLTISHWLAGLWHIIIPRTNQEFFCSAFVSYILTQAGILNQNTDWSIVSPAELSSENDDNMPWVKHYGPDTLWVPPENP